MNRKLKIVLENVVASALVYAGAFFTAVLSLVIAGFAALSWTMSHQKADDIRRKHIQQLQNYPPFVLYPISKNIHSVAL